ncbi:MAG: hypothetical protein FGF51_07685 [Candidatus Brockarchaeota archaeon]|nr:hypothetical protein [Candidatus Brockarchaeota archaeon]
MDILTLVSVLSAIGFSGVGSMLGIAMTASVSSRMVSEKPEKFGLALVFTVLAETPVIYGLLVSLFIIMNGSSVNDFNASISLLSAGLSVVSPLTLTSSISNGLVLFFRRNLMASLLECLWQLRWIC